jgi:hypothetical protein
MTGPTVCARSAAGTAAEHKAKAPRASAERRVIEAMS